MLSTTRPGRIAAEWFRRTRPDKPADPKPPGCQARLVCRWATAAGCDCPSPPRKDN